MKIVTDFKPAAPALKFDADAAELIEAFKTNADVVGAIEVDILSANTPEETELLIGKEVRSFQASALKFGHSARRRETRDNGDGSADVLFTLTVHTPRAPREAKPAETAPETPADVVTDSPHEKQSKPVK